MKKEKAPTRDYVSEIYELERDIDALKAECRAWRAYNKNPHGRAFHQLQLAKIAVKIRKIFPEDQQEN